MEKAVLWNVAKTPDHKDIYNIEKSQIHSFAEVKAKKILPVLSEITVILKLLHMAWNKYAEPHTDTLETLILIQLKCKNIWRNCLLDKEETHKNVNWNIPDNENKISYAVWSIMPSTHIKIEPESLKLQEKEVQAENVHCQEQRRMNPYWTKCLKKNTSINIQKK